MKIPLRLLLPTVAALSPALAADEIHLNFLESPERASTYTLSDPTNSGDLSKLGQNAILCIDEVGPDCLLAIGDADNPSIAGRTRKGFLLFHLPPLEGKKLARATLRLFLAQVKKESPDKPLPPAWLFHAGTWNDESWDSNPQFKGLITRHFSDNNTFNEKIPLAEQTTSERSLIEADVTVMVKKDYERTGEPMAVFRLEVSENESLDITDGKANLYVFWGPNFTPQKPDRVPTLMLSFE
jgi:hypothetical protein